MNHLEEEKEKEKSSWLWDTDKRSTKPFTGKRFISDDEIHQGQLKQEQEQAEIAEDTSWFDSFGAAVDQETGLSWAMKQWEMEEFIPDPDFNLTVDYVKAWREGIDPQYHQALADATSIPHAESLKVELKRTQENNKRIDAHGGLAGFGLRLTAAVADPTAIGLTLASEGVLAPYLFAKKATRLYNAARGAIGGAVGAGAHELYLANERADMDAGDAVLGMTGGVIFGAGFGIAARKVKADFDAPKGSTFEEAAEAVQKHVIIEEAREKSLPIAKKVIKHLVSIDEYVADMMTVSLNKVTKGKRKELDGELKNVEHDYKKATSTLREKVAEVEAQIKSLTEAIPGKKILKSRLKPLKAKLAKLTKEGGEESDRLLAKINHLQATRVLDDEATEAAAVVARFEKEGPVFEKNPEYRSAATKNKSPAENEEAVLEAARHHLTPEEAVRMVDEGLTPQQVLKDRELVGQASFKKTAKKTAKEGAEKGAKKSAIAEDIGLGKDSEEISMELEADEGELGTKTPKSPNQFKHANEQIDKMEKDMPEEVGSSFKSGWRVDRSSFAGSSKVKLARWVNGIIFEDAPGYSNTSLVKRFSASAMKTLHLDRLKYHHNKAFNDNFTGWLKNREKSGNFSNLQGKERELFNEEISKVIRGGTSDDVNVKAMADIQAKLYSQLLEEAVKVGVAGVRNIKQNLNYIPRIWSSNKIRAAIAEEASKYGGDIAKGTQAVAQRIAKNIVVKEGVDPLRVAEGIITVIRSSKSGGVDVHKAITAHDTDRLLAVLRDAQVPEDKIEEFVKTLQGGKGNSKSKVNRLRQRIEIDENSDVVAFFENNAENLFDNYAAAMTGHISLARHGIRDERDFQEIIARIEREHRTKLNSDMNSNQVKQEIENLKDGYNNLIGRPLEADPNSSRSQTARVIRKLGTTQKMGQVGFAQIPEIGIAAAQLGLDVLTRQIPELSKIFSRLSDGKYADQLSEELEDMLGGYSSMHIMNPPTQQENELGAALLAEGGTYKNFLNKAEGGLNRANYALGHASGFFGVNLAIKNITAKGMAQKWTDAAFSDGGKGILTEARLNDLGIGKANYQAIMEQIQRHAILQEGSSKLKSFNIEAWDDVNLQETFALSMRRWGDAIVQDSDLGSSIKYLDDTIMGKALMQFRSFTLQAWPKHLIKAIKYQDMIVVQEIMFSMMMAGLVYQVQQRLTTVGRDDRDETLEETLAPGRWLANSFSRAPIASVAPAIISGIIAPFADSPFHRISQQNSNVFSLDGNPSMSMVHSAGKVYGSLESIFNSEHDYNKRDARNLAGLLPFSNHLTFKWTLERLIEDLPDKH